MQYRHSIFLIVVSLIKGKGYNKCILGLEVYVTQTAVEARMPSTLIADAMTKNSNVLLGPSYQRNVTGHLVINALHAESERLHTRSLQLQFKQ